MSVEELTKKEQIINFAQNDPFLKISDIAEYVQTTARYVRTILSEANISLMKLREKYARSMEKRLQTKDDSKEENTLKLLANSGDMEAGDLGIDELFAEEYDELQKINSYEKLWRITQLFSDERYPVCVKELITFFPEDLTNEKLVSLDSVYELFGRKGINRLQFLDSIVKFEKPSENIQNLLGVHKNDLVMIVSRYISLNKIAIGLENYYLRADKMQMKFSGKLVM